MSAPIILEFLAKYDLELPPKTLYRNLNRHGYDIGYSTVRLHLKNLLENGYVVKNEGGYYEISELGRRWVNDEIDDEELE